MWTSFHIISYTYIYDDDDDDVVVVVFTNIIMKKKNIFSSYNT